MDFGKILHQESGLNLVALSGTTATRYSDSETSYSSDTNAFKLRKFYGKAMTYISSNKTLIILLPSAAGKTGAHAEWGGGALGARAPPPPGKKVPLRNVQKRRENCVQICRQKRMCTFHSDTTKLKRKRHGKNKI